jgi:biofilm PGA synthesis N-glycosyltransferase PgaC
LIIYYFIIPILLAYTGLMIYYYHAWVSIPVFIPESYSSSLHISIIIPARNEEKNMGLLLDALQKQDYPSLLFEIIVVDDQSTDRTAEIARTFKQVKVLPLKTDEINSYKKRAVETAIAIASGDFIVTTDADCIPPTTWLSAIAAFKKENNAVFIAAPVYMEHDHSLLQGFQSMDFTVLQGITGASVSKKLYAMCNGANLAYEKKAFYEVGGFSGIDHLASGDDMMLMEKIREKYPDAVHFLKSPKAIVTTAPMFSWTDFFNQRIRWASKTLHYKNATIIIVLFGVYLFNLCFPVLLIASVWNPCYLFGALALWVIKTLVELPFYSSVTKFFKQPVRTLLFFLFQPLHIIYTCFSGMLSQFGSYKWKGRRVK